MDAQRHAEYYGMQQTFDELYAKSKAGEVFNGLMELVLSPDNIMLACVPLWLPLYSLRRGF